MLSLLTLCLYSAAWAYILAAVLRRQQLSDTHAQVAVAICLFCHSLAIYASLVHTPAAQMGFFKVASLFFFVINLIVLVSSLRQPLLNLFVFLLPLTVLGLIVGQYVQHFADEDLRSSSSLPVSLSLGMLGHIILSILAYSLLTIASIQALLLAYQNKQLKQKHFGGIMSFLPPLQTMEGLLFDIVRAGFLFLTLSIMTGAVYIENLLAQHLAHKTVFSVLSWLIYAVLLCGHKIYGWRGAAAVRWVLGGFVALMLAYFGSKLVIEVILGRSL